MEYLGELVRNERKRLNLTQKELADRAGLSRNMIVALEGGTFAEMGIRKVESVLNAVGYTLSGVPLSRRPTLDQLVEERAREKSNA